MLARAALPAAGRQQDLPGGAMSSATQQRMNRVVCGDHRLRAVSCGDFRPTRVRDLGGMDCGLRASMDNANAHLQALRETGATGLEPATSGVTGRYRATGYDQLRPGITGHSRQFFDRRTGSDRL
jgi:hypothetical protein